jgi:hypothetical protein
VQLASSQPITVHRSPSTDHRSPVFFASALLATCLIVAPAAAEDAVILAAGAPLRGTVEAIAADAVRVGAQSYPRTNVTRIVFGNRDVAASPTRLRLCDGTALCGALRELTLEQVVFRSASLGRLTFPLASVADIRFADGDDPGTNTPAPGGMVLTLTNGIPRRGTLFAATSTHIVLQTADGLQKYAMTDMRGMVLGKVQGRPAMTLRNGDRIGVAPAWNGKTATVALGGTNATVKLSALKEVRL